MELKEKLLPTQSGVSVAGIQVMVLMAAFFFIGFSESTALGWFLALLAVAMLKGYFSLLANQATVLFLQGKYKGTVRQPGFYWVNPLYSKRKLSLKPYLWQATVQATDRAGMPIQASGMAVWQVADTPTALASMENMEVYAALQCQAALSDALNYQAYQPFDSKTAVQYREKLEEAFAMALKQRLRLVGLEPKETRIFHLAPTADVAQSMMQRASLQQQLSLQQHLAMQAVPLSQAILDKLAASGVALSPEQQEKLREQLLLSLASR